MPCDLCQPQTAGHSVLYEYFDGSRIIEMHQKGQVFSILCRILSVYSAGHGHRV